MKGSDTDFNRTLGPVKKSEAAFRTISEVSAELDVPAHVLRFWESKFSHVKPLKRGGGRRYYRPEDITLLRAIRDFLYIKGYTIKGVQKLLREGGVKMLLTEMVDVQPQETVVGQAKQPAGLLPAQRQELLGVLAELEELQALLRDNTQ
tara:strand:+ start:148 stop:594 length:447 start_codon:yes stop_codon:yes gene_type:complete